MYQSQFEEQINLQNNNYNNMNTLKNINSQEQIENMQFSLHNPIFQENLDQNTDYIFQKCNINQQQQQCISQSHEIQNFQVLQQKQSLESLDFNSKQETNIISRGNSNSNITSNNNSKTIINLMQDFQNEGTTPTEHSSLSHSHSFKHSNSFNSKKSTAVSNNSSNITTPVNANNNKQTKKGISTVKGNKKIKELTRQEKLQYKTEVQKVYRQRQKQSTNQVQEENDQIYTYLLDTVTNHQIYPQFKYQIDKSIEEYNNFNDIYVIGIQKRTYKKREKVDNQNPSYKQKIKEQNKLSAKRTRENQKLKLQKIKQLNIDLKSIYDLIQSSLQQQQSNQNKGKINTNTGNQIQQNQQIPQNQSFNQQINYININNSYNNYNTTYNNQNNLYQFSNKNQENSNLNKKQEQNILLKQEQEILNQKKQLEFCLQQIQAKKQQIMLNFENQNDNNNLQINQQYNEDKNEIIENQDQDNIFLQNSKAYEQSTLSEGISMQNNYIQQSTSTFEITNTQDQILDFEQIDKNNNDNNINNQNQNNIFYINNNNENENNLETTNLLNNEEHNINFEDCYNKDFVNNYDYNYKSQLSNKQIIASQPSNYMRSALLFTLTIFTILAIIMPNEINIVSYVQDAINKQIDMIHGIKQQSVYVKRIKLIAKTEQELQELQCELYKISPKHSKVDHFKCYNLSIQMALLLQEIGQYDEFLNWSIVAQQLKDEGNYDKIIKDGYEISPSVMLQEAYLVQGQYQQSLIYGFESKGKTVDLIERAEIDILINYAQYELFKIQEENQVQDIQKIQDLIVKLQQNIQFLEKSTKQQSNYIEYGLYIQSKILYEEKYLNNQKRALVLVNQALNQLDSKDQTLSINYVNSLKLKSKILYDVYKSPIEALDQITQIYYIEQEILHPNSTSIKQTTQMREQYIDGISKYIPGNIDINNDNNQQSIDMVQEQYRKYIEQQQKTSQFYEEEIRIKGQQIFKKD